MKRSRRRERSACGPKRVLVQRKDEGESHRRGIPPFGRGFSRHEDLSVRCVFFCFRAAKDITPPWLIIVRDESVRLSLGMVASPQSPLPFHLTRFLSAMPPHCLRKISTQPVSPLLPARGAFWPTAASDLEPHGFPPAALPTLPAA